MKIFQNIIIALIFSSVFGCSFQSKQYNYISNALSNKNSDGPTPNWVIDWVGEKIRVFAISSEKQEEAVRINHILEHGDTPK